MQKPELVLQRLDWTVIRRLDGLLQGDYRTLFYGYGLDLAELREYQYDDDVRFIDWNVTARLQVPHVRQYTEDREITAWFLLDMSSSVDFGTVKTLKRNLLIDFSSLLARLLTRRGNRIGLILFDGEVTRIIPPAGGKLQVLQMIKALSSQSQTKNSDKTDLTILLSKANRLIKRRSLVFLVSDFISVPGWEKLLWLLTQRHEVLAIRLIDPREIELPDIGDLFLEDAESGEQLLIDSHDSGFRQRFSAAAKEREAYLNSIFDHSGIDSLTLSTEGDMVNDLINFAGLRKKKRQFSTGSLKTRFSS